ncbi:virus tail fibre assembly protein, lambda gpK [Xenorhabdus koppenhoeferi]|uniref:Virus tail fibre assembly protein, lambda gpK n=2 Tax=Xenorhabdus koppenhoeferi TaxID=351659 RepID=A0A1I7HPS8_9GAMM|nr:virus tail fibre assembly protein, lambda gpK [Xenorhabdus koppenhoeferi]
MRNQNFFGGQWGIDMHYVYSAKTNSFYAIALKQDYIDAGHWPEDGIAISDEDYNWCLQPPVGKQRVSGNDGHPKLINIPPPTPEEFQRRAEREKLHRLSQAANKIAPLNDAVDLNIATDEEKSALAQWRHYRVLINRVDCSTTPDIQWPEQPK